MSTSNFEIGTEVEIDKKVFKLVKSLTNSRWQLEDQKTEELQNYSTESLRILYTEGRLRFARFDINKNKNKIPLIIDEIPDEVKVRRLYVKAIGNMPANRPALKEVIEREWRKIKLPESPPGVSTVLRWRNILRLADGNFLSLKDNRDRQGNRYPRYPIDLQEIIDKTIDEYFLNKERHNEQYVFEQCKIAVRLENRLRPHTMHLPTPSRKYVHSRILKIPAYEKHRARYGKDAADMKFRAVIGHRVTKLPLERAEIDHTQLDLFVVDDETFVPLGRPYITTCIDDYTRCVLGFHIGFQPPSYLSVAKCLKHAFMPKDNLRNQYPSIKNPWLPHGVMRELVSDNGLEFHGPALELACAELGIESHFAARKDGPFKGKIERFQGTFNRSLSHNIPGTTFSNIFEKKDYDPVKHAVVTYSTLKEIAHKWIVDYYMQRPHKGLDGMSPAAMWEKSTDERKIRVPSDPQKLDAILGTPNVRRLTHKGIELDRLFYHSLELNELRRLYADSFDVEIRLNDEDLGKIYVISPDKKKIIEVPALRLDYAAGLTRWQHDICRKFSKQNIQGMQNEDAWLEARNEISEIIANDLKLKKGTKKRISSREARFSESEKKKEKNTTNSQHLQEQYQDMHNHAWSNSLPKEQGYSQPELGRRTRRKYLVEHRERNNQDEE